MLSADKQRVYFYVQKNQPAPGTGPSPLTFDVEVLNIGKAINIATGIFTAPVNGVYFFSFSGISLGGPEFRALLALNGDLVGTAISESGFETMTLQSTLQLVAGDQVSILTSGTTDDNENTSVLADDTNRYTHFNGFLLP